MAVSVTDKVNDVGIDCARRGGFFLCTDSSGKQLKPYL
jgi:hypothetical protein